MKSVDIHIISALDMACTCAELHKGHICVLQEKGLTSKIKNLTNTPQFICERCSQEANSENSVCIPLQLFI